MSCETKLQRGRSLYDKLLVADVVEDPAGAKFVRETRVIAGADVADKAWFPGWGGIYVYEDLQQEENLSRHESRLGELASTSICGNDITSSCFYTTGAMAAAAGIWAPFGAIFAAGTLWLFRWVYTEAVTALPFNGGIYNILLNTLENKRIAALMATLTMLSYIATAVVSALSAGSYLQFIINNNTSADPSEPNSSVMLFAIFLIIFFCILKVIGIRESAAVASIMFTCHLVTMAVLMVVATFAIVYPKGALPFGLVASNLRANFNFTGGDSKLSDRIVLGFSNAMLGVSGFESSANFVEEQEPGVFPKTLRNMWYSVSVLNITFIFQCLFATRLEELVEYKDMSLSFLARKVSGPWLEFVVGVDAVVVLAAAVLTSYVGFGGLTCRMSADRCLPSVFSTSDKMAAVLFMVVCISLVLILEGDSSSLQACYSMSFLTVMAFFALSLFILQMERPKLPRDLKNNLGIPALACALVVVALAGAVDSNRTAIPVFLLYFALLNTFMLIFLFRIRLLQAVDKLLIAARCLPLSYQVRVSKWIEKVQQLPSVVYFSKTSNICRLNKAIQYVCQNEDASHCRIVHVYEMEEAIPRNLVRYCQLLDAIYPCIRVDVVFVRGVFGSALVQRLCHEWGVAPNLMFITCPASESVGKRIQDLGGVRVIMGHEEEDLVDSDFRGPTKRGSGRLLEAMEGPRPVSSLLEHNIASKCKFSLHCSKFLRSTSDLGPRANITELDRSND
mmetsp:Transcript_67522/g.133246  ORF Transcript_67522/g.133246 Transcript_67522/m.133246 type:complete len:734 (-) Transcript_67522:165-2366(-)